MLTPSFILPRTPNLPTPSSFPRYPFPVSANSRRTAAANFYQRQPLFLRLCVPWHNYTHYVVECRDSAVRRECHGKRSSRSSCCVRFFESFLRSLSHCFFRRYDVTFVGKSLMTQSLACPKRNARCSW